MASKLAEEGIRDSLVSVHIMPEHLLQNTTHEKMSKQYLF